ncbi:hypothetical protein MAM1_0002d00271 [Mucor ambiguus]|uniref:Uncharacterized protein n=1 Tax=Mucor ambiguus TaxID=91626 RepID=A0A0C9MD54_9FUNG|nr:hypothetical protein MAM1_0002d00271 [Mucor ambiguus]
MSLSIVTNVSLEDTNEDDAVDSKVDDNGTANAIEAKVINGHVEQELTDDVALPQLQNTAKFGYNRDLISHAKSSFRPSE